MSTESSKICSICFQQNLIALPKCVKCGRHFHDGSCGSIPRQPEFDESGWKQNKRDHSRAECGICEGRYPENDQERSNHFYHLQKWKFETESCKTKLQQLDIELSGPKEKVSQLQLRKSELEEKISSKELEFEEMARELLEERKFWRQQELEAQGKSGSHLQQLERLLEISTDIGQSLSYEVFQLKDQLVNLRDQKSITIDNIESISIDIKILSERKREIKKTSIPNRRATPPLYRK